MEKSEGVMWARQSSPVVNAILKSGGDAEDCVIALVKQHKELIKRILYLEGIVPRKIRVGNQIMVWHCPDELVPEGNGI